MRFSTSLVLVTLMLASLAACGGRAPHRGAPGLPAAFGDADPHSWSGRAPVHYPVHGIDAARYQGEIDFRQAEAAGVAFTFLKATEGADHKDEMFATNWRRARAAGMPVGAYHYYYFCRTAEEQARWYIANVPRAPGALPPVLDLEWNHLSRTCRRRPDAAHVRAEARTFLRMLTAHYGQRPIIYTTVDFWRDNDLRQLQGYEFWLRSVAGHPASTYPGADWSFWQYTGTGLVPGVQGKVDINVFAGSAKGWAAWYQARKQ